MRRKKDALIPLVAIGLAMAAGSTESAANPRPQPKLSGPEVVLELPWGPGLYGVGRDDGNESNPEGPMSFTVADNGDIYILDQINDRVVRYHADGQFFGALTLPDRSFEDIEVTADGRVLVMDRLVRSSILVFDADGSEMGEHSILGGGIPKGGGVTAMFARSDGVWLEYNNAYVVKILDDSFRPCQRAAVPGRLDHAGRTSIGARLDGLGGAWVWTNDLLTRSIRDIRDINAGSNIDRIIWIETDAEKRIYMMVHMKDYEEDNPLKVAFEGNLIMAMDPRLNEITFVESAYTIAVWEQYREFKIGPGGSVYQMALTDEGATVFRWQWKTKGR